MFDEILFANLRNFGNLDYMPRMKDGVAVEGKKDDRDGMVSIISIYIFHNDKNIYTRT